MEGKDMTGHNVNNRDNFEALKKDIANICAEIDEHKLTRSHTNEAIAELRARAEAKGVSKQALDWAMKYASLKPEKKSGFDLAYALVREALGDPIQEDLFSAAENIAAANDQAKKDAAKAEPKPDAKAIANAMFEQTTGKKGGNEKNAASKAVKEVDDTFYPQGAPDDEEPFKAMPNLQ